MSINLDSALRAYGQWSLVADTSETNFNARQSPELQDANWRDVENRLEQLKDMASSNGRVASMLGDGGLATLEKLKIMLREMLADMREMWRDFAADLQPTAFAVRITAYETRMAAIDKTYSAAMAQGFSQTLSGIVGVGGAITGSQLTSTGAASFGKISEGFGTMISAAQNRDAQINQAIAEFRQGNADEFRKTLDAAVEKANEASRQMRELVRELNGLQNRLLSAVRY